MHSLQNKYRASFTVRTRSFVSNSATTLFSCYPTQVTVGLQAKSQPSTGFFHSEINIYSLTKCDVTRMELSYHQKRMWGSSSRLQVCSTNAPPKNTNCYFWSHHQRKKSRSFENQTFGDWILYFILDLE